MADVPPPLTTNPDRDLVTFADGSSISGEHWARLSAAERQLRINQGSATSSVLAQSSPRWSMYYNKDPKVISKELILVRDGRATLTWRSKGRFTYAAIFAAGKWYITGDGGWYGGNVFEDDDFVVDVLCHPEVTHIDIWEDRQTLFGN